MKAVYLSCNALKCLSKGINIGASSQTDLNAGALNHTHAHVSHFHIKGSQLLPAGLNWLSDRDKATPSKAIALAEKDYTSS